MYVPKVVKFDALTDPDDPIIYYGHDMLSEAKFLKIEVDGNLIEEDKKK